MPAGSKKAASSTSAAAPSAFAARPSTANASSPSPPCYEDLRGEPYPLDYADQALLYPFPAQGLLILALNSAWQLDHHFTDRAAIHPDALARALTRIRQTPEHEALPLKVAVWHHPIDSPGEDRVKDAAFLQQLAKAGFRLALHGHIHKSDAGSFRYDRTPDGRRIDIVCAGTFGAPVREWVPGYPLQYNLLRIEGRTLTVETRKREEPNGAWTPDARWTPGPGQGPAASLHDPALPVGSSRGEQGALRSAPES